MGPGKVLEGETEQLLFKVNCCGIVDIDTKTCPKYDGNVKAVMGTVDWRCEQADGQIVKEYKTEEECTKKNQGNKWTQEKTSCSYALVYIKSKFGTLDNAPVQEKKMFQEKCCKKVAKITPKKPIANTKKPNAKTSKK